MTSRPVQQGAAELTALNEAILLCRQCRDRPLRRELPHEPRPILRLSRIARIVIASQAPGLRAHTTGIPFNDASGDRLRSWMGIGPDVFHDRDRVAIVPMGFCFPGYDSAKADLPPRRECRALWHDRIFAAMPQIELILCVGVHAATYHRGRLGCPMPRLTPMSDLVARWRTFDGGTLPRLMPLPHPSWRNSGWLNRNPWFAAEVLPVVRQEVARLVATT